MYLTRFCRCGMVWILLAHVVPIGVGVCMLAGMWVTTLAVHSVVGFVAGWSGRRHSFVVGSRPPLRTISGPSKTRHSNVSNSTVYPASHNFAVETSKAWMRPGTMWAFVAVCRSHGMSRLHVCVDWIDLPSGSWTVMGSGSRRMLMAWAPSTRK